MTIPKGAIKDGDLVNICTAVDFYGPFVLPSKCPTSLVSPYYWIGSTNSYRFQKPVKVELEHFAVVTACDPSHYQLLTCADDDESYTMRPVDYELDFKVQGNISLCTFHTQHFCSYCLWHKSDDLVINRIGAFYLKPENFQWLNYYTVEIWFSFLSSYCLKRNKELYTKNGMVLDTNCACSFEVSSDKRSTSYFSLNYKEDFDGWHVDYCRRKEIQTKDINFLNYCTTFEQLKENEENGLFPPRFILKVTKKSKCDKNLNTSITIALNKDGELIKPEPVRFNLFVPISTTTKDPTHTNLPKNNSLLCDNDCVSDNITQADPVCSTECDHPPNQKDFVYVYGHCLYQKPEPVDLIKYDYDYPYHNTNSPELGKKPLHSINDHDCHSNKPELAKLTKYSTKISSRWQEIALELKIPEHNISTINIDHRFAQEKCFAMFSTWLNITIHPCWCHFILALYNVGLSSVAEEAKKHIQGYETVNVISSNTDESILKDNAIDFHELVRFLKDVPEKNTNYFIICLLQKESAIHVIKDIRRNSGSREKNMKKLCEAFLKEDPSWSKVYEALKKAECNDLADFIEACFLPM